MSLAILTKMMKKRTDSDRWCSVWYTLTLSDLRCVNGSGNMIVDRQSWLIASFTWQSASVHYYLNRKEWRVASILWAEERNCGQFSATRGDEEHRLYSLSNTLVQKRNNCSLAPCSSFSYITLTNTRRSSYSAENIMRLERWRKENFRCIHAYFFKWEYALTVWLQVCMSNHLNTPILLDVFVQCTGISQRAENIGYLRATLKYSYILFLIRYPYSVLAVF